MVTNVRLCIALPSAICTVNVQDVYMHVCLLTLPEEQNERGIKNHVLNLCSSSISSFLGLQHNFFTSGYFKIK